MVYFKICGQNITKPALFFFQARTDNFNNCVVQLFVLVCFSATFHECSIKKEPQTNRLLNRYNFNISD